VSQPGNHDAHPDKTMTLEAYADTIIPGRKRWPGDRAIAGLSEDGGAVEAGALAILEMPEGGMAPALDDVVTALNQYADRYRDDNGLTADDTVPAFVSLPADHRVALIQELTAPGHPEKELWTGLALFCYMAYDCAAHMNTTDALAQGHPGLTAMGFAAPDDDGLWRFPDYSYHRPLASLHPDTNATGSLA
jgi:enediyne biosynthesis protein E8